MHSGLPVASLYKKPALCFVFFVTCSFSFAQDFSKGINLTGWFQTSSPREIQFSMYAKKDLQQIKGLGCDVIRLPINLHSMTSGAPDYIPDPLFLDFLDQVVDWAEELQIHLILDNHTFDPAVNTDPSIEDALVKVWSNMAEHYADRSSYLYYEVLNEPHGISDAVWGEIQQSVIDAIRVHDTDHFIVVGGANWNNYNNLSSLPEYADDKLIYTFHFYDPFIFTHQGANWTDPSLAPLGSVPFPYRSADMPPVPVALQGTWIASAMSNYNSEGTVAKVKQLIDIAADFKTSRNVPVFCGEMGVFIPNSNNDDRVAWYNAVRSYLDQKNIAWTMWDYRGGFGLFEKNSNEIFEYDLNVPLLEALAFNVPPQEEFHKTPKRTGFLMYDDYIGAEIVNASSSGGGTLDFYSTNEPETGDYCLYWTEVGQYNAIALDFKPDVDLSLLKDNEFELVFWVRGDSPAAKFDLRFIDSKTDAADHPWRMGVTVDQAIVPMDGEWHEVRIRLDQLVEKGSFDNEWFEPQNKFDWTAIDKFEIVPEHQALDNIQFWFDKIEVAGEDIILSVQDRRENFNFSVFPNPFAGDVTVQYELNRSTPVDIAIYTVYGQKINTLFHDVQHPGIHRYLWNGRNDRGESLAEGIYIVRISGEGVTMGKKVMYSRISK